jgi:hypothetical protein
MLLQQMVNSAGYVSPSIPIDESTRSKTSQEQRDRHGTWDEADISEFIPERWYVSMSLPTPPPLCP